MTGAYIILGLLLLSLALLAYRDIRREAGEIANNVLIPVACLPIRCYRVLLKFRFRIRDLFVVTFLAAMFFAAFHYVGYWALLLLPIFVPILINNYRRPTRHDRRAESPSA